MSGPRGWLPLIPLGLLVTGVLTLLAGWTTGQDIEAGLTERSAAALAEEGLDGGTVTFDGRDATVAGFAGDRAEQAAAVVRSVSGVRVVEHAGAETTSGSGGQSIEELQAEIDRLLEDEPISFVPDTAELTQEGARTAQQVAELLTGAGGYEVIEVGGHVAATPGDESTAMSLSTDRAQTVVDLLVSEGLPTGRITARGYGATQPRTDGGDDRRVEITLR
ncbi:Outer membrane protein OmpA [Amycolatopsis marina]|uniref:Outer membrane protein OmpA n=1 Tax=Amycolatopsis marina TaxID=490629 RepID=A0A1I1CE47_9PSEU|nr:OmpA family protein [Amycolatopsis marina]SFB60352.1 Outer membrane protein OmpA [Amycolatopsis marina]